MIFHKYKMYANAAKNITQMPFYPNNCKLIELQYISNTVTIIQTSINQTVKMEN